jgi:hypothetical protein
MSKDFLTFACSRIFSKQTFKKCICITRNRVICYDLQMLFAEREDCMHFLGYAKEKFEVNIPEKNLQGILAPKARRTRFPRKRVCVRPA